MTTVTARKRQRHDRPGHRGFRPISVRWSHRRIRFGAPAARIASSSKFATKPRKVARTTNLDSEGPAIFPLDVLQIQFQSPGVDAQVVGPFALLKDIGGDT